MRKRLGQHFLKSGKIVNKIIEAAELGPSDVILEIGPGKGILTRALLEKAGKVIAVEKDKSLALKLKLSFKDSPNLEITTADIRDLLKSPVFFKKLGKNHKVVSNIPYYLTSRLFKLLLEETPVQPKRIVLMVQKEVGERITAKPSKTNILALSVQAYGAPKIIAKVSKTYFKPQPKVDSCVLLISDISKDFFKNRGLNENKFFNIVKAGFSHKRKLLLKNLANGLKIEKLSLMNAFKACGVAQKSRAENCSLAEWACLTGKLKT